MASTSHKPLPSIPRRPDAVRNLTNITVEGREHLHRIVESALEDCVVLPNGGRDTWISSVESALDLLGENIARGGWLTGVKRGKIARKVRRAEDLKKTELKEAKELEDVRKSKGKSKAEPAPVPPRREDKELPKDPSEDSTTKASKQQAESLTNAVDQIRELAGRATVPTPKPAAKHLLLCLVPLGKEPPVEDSGFNLVPDNTGCFYTPGVFSLPEASGDGPENYILFGLNEWDGKSTILRF